MTEVVHRLYEVVDELSSVIENARSVPMSGSCMVPRDHLLDLLDDLRDGLPDEVRAAGLIVEQRVWNDLAETGVLHARTVDDLDERWRAP